MGLIDTHAHLTVPELRNDINAVLDRSRDAGVDAWITVGTDAEDNAKAIQLAEEHENVWAAVGFHPHYAKDVRDVDLDLMIDQALHNKVVAVGEIGLDFHYKFSLPEVQKQIFRDQLEIAAKIGKPVVVHSREAFEETIEILDEFEGQLANVVFHCFGGDASQAKIAAEKGYYISFTGVVTFKNAESARLAAAAVPIEQMLVETDCPYMSPAPMRKQKINEPALMIHTAAKLAELKGISVEEFTKITEKNSRDFFHI